MNKYLYYQLELLSDATFGDGTADPYVINTDVLTDKDGFPYMRGKTVKGVIRDSYDKIKDYLTLDENIAKFIFGDEGTQQGNAHFSDLIIPEDIRKTLISSYNNNIKSVSKNENTLEYLVKKTLTSKKSSVSINDGVAEDKALRSERVIKRGIVFEGYIEISKCHELEIDCLRKSIKNLSSIGFKKHRGRGTVRVTVSDDLKSRNYADNTDNLDDLFRTGKQSVILKNIEPLKLRATGKSYDFEESKNYITGSSLRGAFINFISDNHEELGINDTDKFSFIENSLSNIIFSNFYPAIEIETSDSNKVSYIKSIPTPNLFKGDKDSKKKFSAEGKLTKAMLNSSRNEIDFIDVKDFSSFIKDYMKVVDRLNLDDSIDYEANIERMESFDLISDEFCFYHHNNIVTTSVKKTEALHNCLKDSENLFRYNAIDRDQTFYGEIRVLSSSNKDEENKIKEAIMKFIHSEVYIGGSRTSGYGKCLLAPIQSKDKDVVRHINNADILIIMANSDVSIRGYRSLINQFRNCKIYQLVKKEYITSYNRQFLGQTPTNEYIKKGSIIIIDKEGQDAIDFVRMTELIENSYFGDRINEGFGRFIVIDNPIDVESIIKIEDRKQYINSATLHCDKLDQHFYTRFPKNDKESSDFSKCNEAIKSCNDKLVKQFNSNILNYILMSKYDYINITNNNNMENNLSKSQIADIQNYIRDGILEQFNDSFAKTMNRVYAELIEGSDDSENSNRHARTQGINKIVLYSNYSESNGPKDSDKNSEDKVTLGRLFEYKDAYKRNERYTEFKEKIKSILCNEYSEPITNDELDIIALNHIYKVLEILRRSTGGRR